MPNGDRVPFRFGNGPPSMDHTSDSSETFLHKSRSRLVTIRFSRRWRRLAAARRRLRRLNLLRRASRSLRLIPPALDVLVWDKVLLFL